MPQYTRYKNQSFGRRTGPTPDTRRRWKRSIIVMIPEELPEFISRGTCHRVVRVFGSHNGSKIRSRRKVEMVDSRAEAISNSGCHGEAVFEEIFSYETAHEGGWVSPRPTPRSHGRRTHWRKKYQARAKRRAALAPRLYEPPRYVWCNPPLV